MEFSVINGTQQINTEIPIKMSKGSSLVIKEVKLKQKFGVSGWQTTKGMIIFSVDQGMWKDHSHRMPVGV